MSDLLRVHAFLQAVNDPKRRDREEVEARWLAGDLAGRGYVMRAGKHRWEPTHSAMELKKVAAVAQTPSGKEAAGG